MKTRIQELTQNIDYPEDSKFKQIRQATKRIKTESTRSSSNKWTVQKPSTKIIYIVLQTSVGLF